MSQAPTRRHFLAVSGLAAASTFLPSRTAWSMPAAGSAADDQPIRVVIWDEQQPAQKTVYENFIGNWIAHYLASRPGLAVQSVKLTDPEQGLSQSVLGDCQVLLWWGHQRHAEINPETGKKLVERIKAGTLNLIALHSAHWSTPFVEAMNVRTRQRAEERFQDKSGAAVEIRYVPPRERYLLPKPDARLTPYAEERRFPDDRRQVTVHLPICCFPAYRADGKPSQLRVLLPEHPIARGLPATFELPHTEMYDEPFHVPEPDEVVLEERWATGEWFRSGMVWKIGKGRVFYFRPGHETFAVYKEKPVLQLLENAARLLGTTSAN
jgi:trehalose utilization protein